MGLGFQDIGVSQTEGYLLGSTDNMDYIVFWGILGSRTYEN